MAAGHRGPQDRRLTAAARRRPPRAAIQALGFIGLGVMGEGMCASVVRKSPLPVHGTDLNPEPLARLAALDLARTAGIDPTGARATQALLAATRSNGFAKEYYPVFLKTIEATRNP